MEESIIENMKETLLTHMIKHIFKIGALKIFLNFVRLVLACNLCGNAFQEKTFCET